MKTKNISILTILAISLASTFAGLVIVPGTGNPWLAGMSDGSTAMYGDVAPAESPVLALRIASLPGMTLSFTASGGVSRSTNTVDYPLKPPDGTIASPPGHDAGAEHGIANLYAPYESLIGVFLGDDVPDSSPAPPGLSFSTADINFGKLQPELKQPFFIGDGRTSDGSVQIFVIPQGATRLFLGPMDQGGWYDNAGQFSVQVNTPPFLTIQNSGGHAGITVGGPVGSTNLIQYVTNMSDTNWLTLTNVVLSNAPSFFIDTESSITGQRFYRAVRNE